MEIRRDNYRRENKKDTQINRNNVSIEILKKVFMITEHKVYRNHINIPPPSSLPTFLPEYKTIEYTPPLPLCTRYNAVIPQKCPKIVKNVTF